MINRTVLVGRITKDLDLRYSPAGVAILNFNIAVNRAFTNQQGEREADFPNIVCFKKQAENVANFCKKGSLVGIDGRIQTRKYEGQNGKVYVTEVVADSIQFLEPKGSNNQSNTNTSQGSRNSNTGNSSPLGGNSEPFDDGDLPF
ncbi:single-stranded DNA-binding protein [Bacillus weihaiensis]|uniref:single-stranded DNA-binding protein n=1 Tax=Bacillus weihaiensis TaxID=1547283 RepID=UPI0023535E81|nr:single-stranded DNA-binding protein [Bacillus weihaiensis]